jgi:hypothetical protein
MEAAPLHCSHCLHLAFDRETRSPQDSSRTAVRSVPDVAPPGPLDEPLQELSTHVLALTLDCGSTPESEDQIHCRHSQPDPRQTFSDTASRSAVPQERGVGADQYDRRQPLVLTATDSNSWVPAAR